ncbi:MAG: UvrD-helicase domain-containing protein [Taibaiella sp.]|nr:UvrD-helicase domain-containing protein [Taibaiella sp.]
MAMSNNTLPFDVRTVPLSGKNLVEASAGTGKTFSIGILILRMILEKQVPLENQLIVTYTNFAVAELQERIRAFIKEAYNAATGQPCREPLIQELIEQAMDKDGLKDRLRTALLLLDEAPIMTIHGFCQQMLFEFAFETGQPFQLELQTNVDEFIDNTINAFWRKELSLLPPDMLELKDLEAIRKMLRELFGKGLAGTYFAGHSSIGDNLDISYYQEAMQQAKADLAAKKEALLTYPIQHKSELLADLAQAGKSAEKAFVPKIEDPEQMFAEALKGLTKKEVAAYFQKLQSPYWDLFKEYLDLRTAIAGQTHLVTDVLLLLAQRDYLPLLKEKIRQSNVLTFDAMILNLHKAIVIDNNEKLCTLIREKYKVVFIDEFQDTDIIQFQLFKKLFVEQPDENEGTLFLIGDPKQSIYAFRNADVESYLYASTLVGNKYSMATNFRSSQHLVHAANHFFNAAGAAAFGYEESDAQKIVYHTVTAKHATRKLLKSDVEQKESLFFAPAKNEQLAFESICEEIATLLNPANGYQLQADEDSLPRPVRPEDIAILVRQTKFGRSIKQELQKLDIPAVNVDDAKVLDTKEAQDLSLILQAMIQPNIKNVKSALYLTFLNELYMESAGTAINISRVDDSALLGLFSEYHQLTMEQKTFQALMKLFSDFNLQQQFSKNFGKQRVLSNLMQLAELLHQQQYRKALNADELWVWLRQSAGANVAGDEFTLQIESDEHAVQILTLHKSKGLEYPIVFVYGVHTQPDIREQQLHTLKTGNGNRILKLKPDLDEKEQQQLLKNEDQELRRLIYVAITRAAYRCYIYYSTDKFAGKPLHQLMQTIPADSGIVTEYNSTESGAVYRSGHEAGITTIGLNLKLAEQSRAHWGLYSYSALSIKHEFEPRPYSNELTAYDQFIFNQLERGADIGTKLHELFEQIDFQKDYTQAQLDYLSNKLLHSFDKTGRGKEVDNAPMIVQLLHHVLNARIDINNTSYSLSAIPPGKRLNELEFMFPLQQEQSVQQLLFLLQHYDTGIQDKYQQLNGMMTGFIDLLFEYEDRFYILDWKSNYLGFEVKDYEGENLAQAMHHSQYTLQYLIYTVAVHKFLKQRMGAVYDYEQHFGGVIYVFLRGARAGQASGIFTDRPDKLFIEALEQALEETT